MRFNGGEKNSLENLFNELNAIENQLNINRNRNKGHSKERISSNFQRDIKPNEDYIRQIVKQEFYSLISPFQQYQHEIAKISKQLRSEVNNNKLKINEIEYKLSFPNLSVKSSSLSDNDNNTLKKNEFDFKKNEIKMDPELYSSLSKIKFNCEDINKLKYDNDYIKSQIEALKKDLNKILISNNSISKNEFSQHLSNNSILNKEYINEEKLEKRISILQDEIKKELLTFQKTFISEDEVKKIISNFKNEINPNFEKVLLKTKKVNLDTKEIQIKFEKKIKEFYKEIEGLKNKIDEINKNISICHNQIESVINIHSINGEINNNNGREEYNSTGVSMYANTGYQNNIDDRNNGYKKSQHNIKSINDENNDNY